jgi:hypothetical protein
MRFKLGKQWPSSFGPKRVARKPFETVAIAWIGDDHFQRSPHLKYLLEQFYFAFASCLLTNYHVLEIFKSTHQDLRHWIFATWERWDIIWMYRVFHSTVASDEKLDSVPNWIQPYVRNTFLSITHWIILSNFVHTSRKIDVFREKNQMRGATLTSSVMDQRSICLFLARKEVSALEIHNEFVIVLDPEAEAYSTITKYLWQWHFPAIMTELPDEPLWPLSMTQFFRQWADRKAKSFQKTSTKNILLPAGTQENRIDTNPKMTTITHLTVIVLHWERR